MGYIRGNLETNIDGTYIVQPSNKKALVSRLFGHGSSVCMKVINDSYKFITFKKGSLIGHAEPADLFLTAKLLKQVYIYIIEQAFNREGSLYLACNDKNAFLLLNNLNDINCGHVRKCVMRSIIFWTIYL